MKRIFSILAFLLIFSSVCFCQQHRVAVYVLGPGKNYFTDYTGHTTVSYASNTSTKAIEGAIVVELTRNGNFKIADRSDAVQSAIGREFSVQSSGSINYSQIMKLGNQIGAEYICVVEIEDLPRCEYNVVGKLINVEENSIMAASNFSMHCYESEDFQKLGKRVANDILKPFAPNKPKNKVKIVGPLTFQEAIDYEIPKGYSTFDEGVKKGFTVPDAINALYDKGVYVEKGGRFVISRTKTKSNNRVFEMLCHIRNNMSPFHDYENRSPMHKEKDYYSYCYDYGEDTRRVRYMLEFDNKGNSRYIDSDGKKKDKNFTPGGWYYIILLPDD